MRPEDMTPVQRIERSIQKKYLKTIWNPFVGAIQQYQLIQSGDRIAACVSGGKDSMLLAKLLQMLQRHSDVPFELKMICMDPGYRPENRQKIEKNAALLDLPLTIFSSEIFTVVQKVDGSPCYLCARMRRGHLYKKAQELGCNKIALAHHFSDVVETSLMGMLYGAQIQTMPPKLHSQNFVGMELIRPLYCVHEDDVRAWMRSHQLEFIQCGCPLTENCPECSPSGESEDETGGSKRQEVKRLIRQLKRNHPNVEKCIFQSMHNVRLDTVLGYAYRGEKHSFLDDYDA
ncbi:MAG: tRNA 2-thiocytidine biosynthesis TtcA family protein [Oscillospiraceae bacterium]|jgi:tRNA(Ile)-lysidine synthase TilS/MesJ|nr:tRNA 2-thiocytidine biosynthesis TtcA family protein [Oscillospiraceae bacterium]